MVYGLGYLSLEKEPVVIQVPDFGDRFWTIPVTIAFLFQTRTLVMVTRAALAVIDHRRAELASGIPPTHSAAFFIRSLPCAQQTNNKQIMKK